LLRAEWDIKYKSENTKNRRNYEIKAFQKKPINKRRRARGRDHKKRFSNGENENLK